jgi:lipid II:glycine glycyltransferase (peptidoglycan interpeptide bridge formation enzyme)
MATIETKQLDQQTWEKFMSQHDEANFLHSWYWGNFHERLGHKVERRGFYYGDKLVGIVQGVVEPARRGRHLVIAGGPIIDWSDKALIKAWVKEIRNIARSNKCIFIRVRPQLINDEKNRKTFKELGFKKAPMHVTADLTSQLDLTKTDEELKKAMRKGTRYELNKATRIGIKVESATDTQFLDEFFKKVLNYTI